MSLLAQIKELIPGTSEYTERQEKYDYANDIIRKWSSGETVSSQIRDRVTKNRDFYLGVNAQQFNNQTVEGSLRIQANVGATVLDLIVFLLSNNMPSIQAVPAGTGRSQQVEASIAEALVAKAFKDAGFPVTFRNVCKMLVAFAGFAWIYPFWNEDEEFGKKKNRFDMTLLNPFSTRVFWQDTDYKKFDCFITTKRFLPKVIYEEYDGFVAYPDSENPFIPQEIMGEGVDDGKTTVFKMYDDTNAVTVICNEVVRIEPHGLDFTPLVAINNVYILNEPIGFDDLYRALPIAQELNSLLTAASDIARDLAYPPLLEFNNALAGKKVSKWRGTKVPVRRTDKGEALQYLAPAAQIEPLLKQIQLLLDLFHFVSLMPKAAAGIFDSTVTSGFQARIAMQPATLSSENKRLDIDEALVRLAKIALYMIEKNDPKALQISDNMKITELHDMDFNVRWPDNLPIDIAREIQNLILGIQNSLTSTTQAIDKYNVLMGMGSSEDTIQYLKQEANDPELAPDRALKIAQVQQTLSQMQANLSSIQEKLGGGMLPPQATEENDVNFQRAAGQPLPEEQKQAPDTSRESVALESTGGQVITP